MAKSLTAIDNIPFLIRGNLALRKAIEGKIALTQFQEEQIQQWMKELGWVWNQGLRSRRCNDTVFRYKGRSAALAKLLDVKTDLSDLPITEWESKRYPLADENGWILDPKTNEPKFGFTYACSIWHKAFIQSGDRCSREWRQDNSLEYFDSNRWAENHGSHQIKWNQEVFLSSYTCPIGLSKLPKPKFTIEALDDTYRSLHGGKGLSVNTRYLNGLNDKLRHAWDQHGNKLKFKSAKNPIASIYSRQSDQILIENRRLKVPGFSGKNTLKIINNNFADRIPPNAAIRDVTISCSTDGWYASVGIAYEGAPETPVDPTKIIAVDWGVVHHHTDSNGKHRGSRETPELQDKTRQERVDRRNKLAKRRLRRMAKLQKQASRQVKGSKNQQKTYTKIARWKQWEARTRKGFTERVSTNLTEKHDIIIVEDLNLRNMTKRSKRKRDSNGKIAKNGRSAKAGLNRSILNGAPGAFVEALKRKAKCLLKVDPKRGSQECAQCGHIDPKNRVSQSEFKCLQCGHSENADTNAAQVYFNRGIDALKRIATINAPLNSSLDGCLVWRFLQGFLGLDGNRSATSTTVGASQSDRKRMRSDSKKQTASKGADRNRAVSDGNRTWENTSPIPDKQQVRDPLAEKIEYHIEKPKSLHHARSKTKRRKQVRDSVAAQLSLDFYGELSQDSSA